jgi:hypothetical protein
MGERSKWDTTHTAATCGARSRQLFIRTQLRSLAEVMDSLQMMAAAAFGKGMKINRSENSFKFPNGSVIEFAPLADTNDIAKLQGRSFEVVYCDEYGNCSPAQMRHVDQIRANLRGNSGCPTRFVLLGNPAGVGHTAIVNRYIKKLPPWQPTTLADETEWLFCPATYKENANLPANYQKDLMASAGRDKALMLAWTEGRWDIAKGALLSDVIDPAKQMFDVKDLGFGVNDRNVYGFLSGDWGVTSPSVVYLACRLLNHVGRFPANSLILVDEVSSADPDDFSIGQQWSPSFLADRILEMCDRHNLRNRSGCFDNARGLVDDTVIEIMRRSGLTFVLPVKGRLDNMSAMRELLANSLEGNNRPGLWVSSLCVNWWETVPVMPRDNLRPDLPAPNAVDHAYDASAYSVSHVPRLVRNRFYIP